MRNVITLAMVVLILGIASILQAQSRDPAAAEVLFRDARTRMEAGDYASACPKFAESLRLDFAPGPLLNLAACEEQLGQLASAWQHFVQVAELLPANDERHAFALERAASLDRRVPRLTILVERVPAGTRVLRDDVELGSATFGVALPVNPGEHVVTVITPGHPDGRFNVTLRATDRRVLKVAPGDLTADDMERQRAASKRRTVGWIVGGVGVASLVAGTYFGIRALDDRSRSDSLCGATTCRDAAGVQAYDDAKTFSRVADVAFGVGIAAVAVGGYLLLTSPATGERPAPPPRAAVHLTPFGVAGTW